MSMRYKGAVISATPPTTSSSGAAGSWTLQQQMQAQAGGNWPFGGPFNYIEDVFSTYLYTGNGSTQTITNGIDLAGNGGMVWLKARDGAFPGNIFDTVRNNGYLETSTNRAVNGAGGGTPPSSGIYPFNSNGFTFADGLSYWNSGLYNYASWTFRKQPKFFDVVTYTGDGTSSRNISHSLGSTPGCIIVKRTDSTSDWFVSHVGYNSGLAYTGVLNSTAAFASGTQVQVFYSNSTTFRVGTGANDSGATYVAYLFAHNAGGFGTSNADNVISCGSYTTDGSGNATINLGYEPQWLMIKSPTAATENWIILDNMRGIATGGADPTLYANLSNAEATTINRLDLNATGFVVNPNTFNVSTPNTTYIYIAIRRGPMKTPTTGTSVFAPALASSSGTYTATSNFPVDWAIEGERAGSTKFYAGTRLTGDNTLQPNTTGAESAQSWGFDNMTGYTLPGVVGDYSGFINWMMRRAPGFFDVVCYTGTGSATTQAHNLGVAPEMMILKKRSASGSEWPVYVAPLGATQGLYLGPYADPAITTSAYWNNTAPTSTVFTVGNASAANQSSATYVAYLFASCPGVSKVGSYTGTGTTKQIDCGFTGGARFVLIKRTDSTGDWYVWDSARGIVAGNDPYLLLNSTAAEVTNTDYVDAYAAGFEISSTAPAAINANGGTFIFLAVS